MTKFGQKYHLKSFIVSYLLPAWMAIAVGALVSAWIIGNWQPVMLVAGFAGLLILPFGYFVHYLSLKRAGNNIEAVRQAIEGLSQGELGITLDVESGDELALLGAAINDLSANLQELMLHIWQQTARSQRFLGLIENGLKSTGRKNLNDELLKHLEDAVEALSNLRHLVTTYAFYDVRLEDEKPVTVDTGGKKEFN